MTDPRDQRSQKVSLLTWEWWVTVNSAVQVTSQHLFDEATTDDVLWMHIRQLHPVVQYVVCGPIHFLVDTLPSWLLTPVAMLLLDVR